MSVMLEALRKAERRARGDTVDAAAGSGATATGAPDSGRATEFALEPIPAEATPDSAAAVPPTSRATRARAANEQLASAGSAAQAPRERRFGLPWLYALGLIGLIAASAGLHLWNELRPRAALQSVPPARPSVEKIAAAPAPAPEVAVIPGLPAAPLPPATGWSRSVPRVAPPTAAGTPAAPVKATAAQSAAPRQAQAAGRSEAGHASRIHVQVRSGYAAFAAGDLDLAHAAYEQVLREEPSNRDAVLGMAALDIHAGRLESAATRYAALLRAAPDDPEALAGLLGLRAAKADPLQTESRLKTALASHPDAASLHFTLGNQLARQGRWAEAQQAYSRADAHDREHPDLAFNLAVSLDRLHRSDEAIEHYARALRLAQRRAAAFSPETVRLRLQQLQR
jgi:tetratricopeptide (TPR) repeat protein